jgi:hypothetical protein
VDAPQNIARSVHACGAHAPGETVMSAMTIIEHERESNAAVTEFVEMPNRGHALTIDHGWHEVADAALAFVRRFV